MKGPSLLAGIGLLLVLSAAAVGTPADADLWGHLTFGRDIIDRRQIVQADTYSFTNDRPWVNHEWLAEVAFAESYRLGGSTGLVAFKLLFIGGLVAFVWRHVRRNGASAQAGLVLVTMAFVGTFWRMHTVRPQLFSVLFFAVLLMAMTEADAGRRLRLWLVPLLMALWVNVHGGWIVGLGILGIWTAIRLFDPRMPVGDRLVVAGIGLSAVGATLLNPYGVHMWTFLAETVRFGRADIEEWGSILTHPLALGLPWAVMFVVAGMAVWRSNRPRRWDYIGIVLFLAAASFRVSRLDAFFAVAAIVLLAPELTAWLSGFFASQTRSAPASPQPTFGMVVITVVAVAAMLVPAAGIIVPYATCLTIAGPWVPEPEAGRFIQVNQLRGRMLTWFDWGEYALWHFNPHLLVSIDGRRETVYSEETIQAHRRFYAGDVSYLGEVNPDYIWLPNHLPVTNKLAQVGWRVVFSGSASAVYAREGAGPFQQVGPSGTVLRCFPGP